MSDELSEKVKKLPLWVRERIKYLEDLPQAQVNEIVQLRQKVARLSDENARLKDRVSAMLEFFQCAAKGGSEVAAAVQRITEDWLVPDHE